MKFITVIDNETKDVVVQLGEQPDGTLFGIYGEGYTVVADGEIFSNGDSIDLDDDAEEEEVLNGSGALPCSCGASEKDLSIVKTLTTYLDKGNLSDIEIEYKVVCDKCGKEGDLSRNKDGAILSWNETILKGKLQ